MPIRSEHCIWLIYLLIIFQFIGSSLISLYFLAIFMLLLLALNKLSHFIFSSHSLNFIHWTPVVLFYMSLCPLYFLLIGSLM